MKVLVTGFDGYCGWPLTLALVRAGHTVFGVDNEARREWVEEVGGESVVPIVSARERADSVKELWNKDIRFTRYDMANMELAQEIVSTMEFDYVVHLASQPSAPFSEKTLEHLNFTQNNNTQMLRNILWTMKGMRHPPVLIVTTTTGVYGAPTFVIPEGDLYVDMYPYPFPGMGGSWYHMSRVFDSLNLWLAHQKWKINSYEFRTAIVCGSSTEETRLSPMFATRFDCDRYFGTVANRFIAMAVAGKPLTIYGRGNQGKPYVSLDSFCRSIVNLVGRKSEPKTREIFNQMEAVISPKMLADMVVQCAQDSGIPAARVHIPNPRVENETAGMVMENEKFLKLISGESFSLSNIVLSSIADIMPYRKRLARLLA